MAVWVGAFAAVGLFLFAVQLLGAATEALAPALRRSGWLAGAGDLRALGLGWLVTYALTNGSVVAALSLSLFDAGLVSQSQLYVLLAGSRLGGAAVVVLVGGVDFVQKRRFSLREATSLGLLTFLLTQSVYLPATALGYLWLSTPALGIPAVGPFPAPAWSPLSLLAPATGAVTDSLGAAPGFVLAILVLLGSLQLFDRVLDRADTGRLRRRYFGLLKRRWRSFAVGLVVTTLTTSVALSLGLAVPLYNRGYLEREEVVPYVLGANLGTLVDTLAVAVVLGSPVGVSTTLTLAGAATLVTLLALVAYEPYHDLVAGVLDWIVADRRRFLATVLVLVAVPGLFVLAG